MRIHKEGLATIILAIIVVSIINTVTHLWLNEYAVVLWLGYLVSAFLLIIILQFFRNPYRPAQLNESNILSPCDGKVVVIEEVEEPEYFKDKRIQVSIFMSPLNVHVNRFPIGGKVKYAKYHPGLYLVAWHPKSSTDNERTTVVVEHANGASVLFRQIAGALARRIVYYCKEGDAAIQGNEMGFIKFGSRVDLFLPLNAKIQVKLGDVVKSPQSIIATF